MHILITGKPRTGKTTLVKKIIKACGPACGGFYTEEIARGGERRGFLMRTTSGREGVLAEKGWQSPHRLGKYGINQATLEEIGVEAVEKALQDNEIVVIDEIGKMELFSQKFKDVVIKALESKKRVVGVIHQAGWPFLNAVRERPDVLLLEVSGENNAEVWEKIKSLLGI
jgi:nucleoside-triphosphatase